ncbi:hypothetical protein PGT21_029023 [Puccinia graminis f. sp. tritici]|uniref:RGS domain-containing protein n=1 Tax=Puccinia graminis f. sp. tritici TaxID=56615 RepID=A0A5B0Q7F9_PUCGR|nr:hypothetical protein PGT21_029023 [Puccinia graminis f. sp. tritici]KAA1109160.1 hypothetical protein PGTUg99_008491 [Puccinia graminis f. sp. tritici]
MLTGYENNYGSDWTRQRTLDNGTDIDMATELGTTLSRSTTAPAPALQRLSFARHPSVIGSSLSPAPLLEKIARPANQNMGDGIVFGTMAQNNSSPRDSSSCDQSPRDIQAVLDGLTSKPLGLTDFKRFLNEIRRGAYSEECNCWIIYAPLLVDFLLDFKRYADGFARLSLREQSQCPHPFEIICHLNSQNPEAPKDSSDIDFSDLRQDVGFSQFEKAARELSERMPADFDANPSHEHPDDNRTPTMEPENPNRPHRKVNWAPSVRSNNHQYDPDLDSTGSTLSATLHEGSILRAARHNSKATSQFSSNVLMQSLRGVAPDHQPMRDSFNALVIKYLGSSTSLKQQDGLLSSYEIINFESIQRAILEANYTNHPAVLSGIVAEILVGLNVHVLPVFVAYSITNQNRQTNVKSKTLWGSLLVLITFIFNLLMMIVPSPLITPWKIDKPIPKIYRLLLFPLIWIGFALIISDFMKTYCLLCWNNKFKSIESIEGAQSELRTQDKITNSSENMQNGPSNSRPVQRHEANRLVHKLTTCLSISLVLAVIIQICFVLLPLLP